MPRPSAVDLVINQVKDWITDGTYKSGDRLPPEGDICSICNVSRGPVREAMKVLSAVGLVEVKQGDGTYITKDEGTGVLLDPLLLSFQKSYWNKQELAEFRGAIEHSVVELIIKKASDEELKNLRAINYELVIAVETQKSRDEMVDIDLRFHKKMGELTHNVFVFILYSRLLEFLFKDVSLTYKKSASMGSLSAKMHGNICAALENRDLPRALREIDLAMENHVIPIEESADTYEKAEKAMQQGMVKDT